MSTLLSDVLNLKVQLSDSAEKLPETCQLHHRVYDIDTMNVDKECTELCNIDNNDMSVKSIPTYTQLLYGETGAGFSLRVLI